MLFNNERLCNINIDLDSAESTSTFCSHHDPHIQLHDFLTTLRRRLCGYEVHQRRGNDRRGSMAFSEVEVSANCQAQKDMG